MRASSVKAVAAFRVLLALCVTVALGVSLSACGSSGSGASDAKTINLLTYETYHDPTWLAEFTKETGIAVNVVTVASPAEMFAKVRSNANQFDIALVTSGWFDTFNNANLLDPVDSTKIVTKPTLGFDWQSAASSKGTQYGVLYNWGNLPLAWLPDTIPNTPEVAKYLDDKGRPNDWNILWDPAFTGKVSVPDDPTSILPMVSQALGQPNPYNLDDAQMAKMQTRLDALRPQMKRLTSGFNDQTTQFASREATIGILANIASATQLKKQGITLEMNNEVKQGVPAWSDNYAITKAGAKKADAVYKFINYTLTVPWQARFIASSGNSGTLSLAQATSPEAVTAGLTQEALEATLIPATAAGESFFKSQIFEGTTENLDHRLDVWNQFKLGMGS